MKESWIDSIKRSFHEVRIRIVKWMIFRLVHRLDDLQYGEFMALSWCCDEHTDYHVIAERSYENIHVYGTRVDYLDKDVMKWKC